MPMNTEKSHSGPNEQMEIHLILIHASEKLVYFLLNLQIFEANCHLGQCSPMSDRMIPQGYAENENNLKT